MTNQVAATNNAEISDAELDAILAGESVDSLFAEESEAVQEDVVFSELDLEAVAISADIQEANEEAAEVLVPDTVIEAASPTKSKRGPSTAGLKPSKAIKTKLGDKVYDVLCLNDETMGRADIDDLLNASDDLAKKTGEKVANICYNLANGLRLSVYTQIAIDLLEESGSISINELKAKYQAHPYTVGTANAQASQLFQLLPFMKMAERSGTVLTKRADSLLMPILATHK